MRLIKKEYFYGDYTPSSKVIVPHILFTERWMATRFKECEHRGHKEDYRNKT